MLIERPHGIALSERYAFLVRARTDASKLSSTRDGAVDATCSNSD
jgi:hypothetical protein